MADSIKITSEKLNELFFQLSVEEQIKFFTKIQKKLSKKSDIKRPSESAKELLLADKFPIEKYGENLPSIGNIEVAIKKHRITKEQLEPLKELFKDAPAAKDLVKMLTP